MIIIFTAWLLLAILGYNTTYKETFKIVDEQSSSIFSNLYTKLMVCLFLFPILGLSFVITLIKILINKK